VNKIFYFLVKKTCLCSILQIFICISIFIPGIGYSPKPVNDGAGVRNGFNILFVFSKSASNISILKDRTVKGKTLIYICKEGVCRLPVESAGQAMELLK